VDASSEAARPEGTARRQRNAGGDAGSTPASTAASTAAATDNRRGTAPAPALTDKPTPEQRQRLLDSAQGDAAQLERRKKFLEAIDAGDPQALERWRSMQQRRREGGANGGGSGNGNGTSGGQGQ
jgi:multidrug efflux system membrane fusion protein